MASVLDFSATAIDGSKRELAGYAGSVLLIVNVASRCGFTPQYEGLQELYQRYHARGFEVLGFPCNQFGSQEPGDEAEIVGFCATNYSVTFPMFAKIDVNGAAAHPLYRYLTSTMPGVLGIESIKWNFTKFLVDARGHPVRRYAPTTAPAAIGTEIEALLPAPSAESVE
jgi:glutathione peroxidase